MMTERIGRVIAGSDRINFSTDTARFRRMARTVLAALATPTQAIVRAPPEAAGATWVIGSRRDHQREVNTTLAAPAANTDKPAKLRDLRRPQIG